MRAKFIKKDDAVHGYGIPLKFLYKHEGVDGFVMEATTTSPDIRLMSTEEIVRGWWRGGNIHIMKSIFDKAADIEIISSYDALQDAMKARYGNNAWVKSYGSEIEVYVHYPSIKIVNSFEIEHTIKDLVVCIKFRMDDPNWVSRMVDLRGRRYTMSSKELACGYAHSHLDAGSPHEYSQFCLGSGTVMDNLKAGRILMNDYTVMNWDLFFHQLDTYVSWESLEGNPYITLSSIEGAATNDAPAPLDDGIAGPACFAIAAHLLENLDKYGTDFIRSIPNHYGVRYSVKVTEEFIELCEKMTDELDLREDMRNEEFDFEFRRYLVAPSEDETDAAVSASAFENSRSLLNPNTGDYIEPQVADDEPTPTSAKIVLNPYMIMMIVQNFELLINEAAFYAHVYETKGTDQPAIAVDGTEIAFAMS